MTFMLYIYVLAPIVIGLTQYILNRFLSKSLVITVQVILFALSLFMVRSVESTTYYLPLLSIPVPYGMALRLDDTSALFLLLNNFLFLALTVFSIKKDYMNRLFLFLFLSLQGMINGLFLSTDLFNLYLLIEVATITISILIMFRRDRQSMYDGMLYLTINMIAMAFFLFGIGVLYKLFGVLDIDTIQISISNLSNKRLLHLPFAFLMTGIGLKAAILPLFSWLPKAHGTASAPSTVSAILSGIFVKIGIYLLIRLQIMFQPSIDVSAMIFIIGFMTAIAGFTFAIAQQDIKLVLAYHTVSQVGLILVGISGQQAINHTGGLYHILSHGIFKSLFFIIAGVLIHHYETRKIGEMHSLWRHSKSLSIILMVAVLSITGAPFFSGGFSKYFIAYGYTAWYYKVVFQLINWGTMISFVKFILLILPDKETPRSKIALQRNEWLSLGVFAALCLLLGSAGKTISTFVLYRPLELSIIDQLSKLPLYLFNYALCFAIYHLYIKKSRLFKKLRTVELSFNSINIAIVSFFFFTLTYLNLN